MEEFLTHSPQETEQLGEKLAACLAPGTVIALYGDLGSGKTCFTRGFCRHFGIPEVKSPSFILINRYEGKDFPLWHIDLYRMEEMGEILELGLEEIFSGPGIALVEWAEKGEELLPADCWKIEFAYGEQPEERRVKFFPPA